MLTCLVCGTFDLFTSADLLPVARTFVAAAPKILDLNATAGDDAAGLLDTDDELAVLLVAGRSQRSKG